jgi:Ni/Fe-hydrogenase 1 B-type cytochrome subunit
MEVSSRNYLISRHEYRRVYVWERPVRIFHWLNAFSILILAVTGFIIADPPAIMSGTEATYSYWFGIVRFIHFATAYLFAIVIVLRLYWSFVGNKFASWRAFFPYTKKGMQNIAHVLKIDILLVNPEKFDITKIAVGHNALAAMSYSVLFILIAIQIFTGFGLYSDNATWWAPKLFAWVVPMLGGDAPARLLHHVIMWCILLFSVVHIYLAFYHDWLEGRGEISSIFSGFKFVRSKRVKENNNHND